MKTFGNIMTSLIVTTAVTTCIIGFGMQTGAAFGVGSAVYFLTMSLMSRK